MALRDEILTDGPLGYWEYGYTGDSSGNALHLTYTAAPTPLQPQQLPGAASSSTKFASASKQYLYRAHSSALNVGDTFTIEFVVGWVPDGSTQYLVTKGVSSYAVRLADNGSGSATVELVKHGTGVVASATVAPWLIRHVVITKSGSTRKIYVDGVDSTVLGTNQTMVNTSSNLDVGWSPAGAGSAYFNSYLSDLAIYSKALTASDALRHFYATRAKINAEASLEIAATFSGAATRRALAAGALGGTGATTANVVRRMAAAADGMGAVGDVAASGVRRGFAASNFDVVLSMVPAAFARLGGSASLGATFGLVSRPAGVFIAGASLDGHLQLVAGRDLATFPLPPEWLPPQIVAASETSERLLNALARSHQLALLVQILDPITGQPAHELDTAINGAVTLDSGAAIRGRLDLELADDGLRNLIPTNPTDLLTPYGTEIRVARGIRFPDGTAEVISLGIFRIRQVDTLDTGDSLTIRLTGLDRWSRFADARFERTTIIPSGTNKMTAILQLAQEAWPDVPHDLPSTTATLGQQIAERGDDRGELMRDIAASMGQEIFFDGSGILTARPIAQATDTARWQLTEGQNGLLLEASRGWDAERVYNKVIASGEPMDDVPPVCAQVWDDNPNSPTYFYGPFGQRPRFYVSSMLSTAQQAQTAAAGILAKAIGTSQKVDFGSIVNPAMEPGTVVRVARDRLGMDERHVVDTLTIPLGATESMTGTTRLMELEAE